MKKIITAFCLFAFFSACSVPEEPAKPTMNFEKFTKPVPFETEDDHFPTGKLDAETLMKRDDFERLDSIFSPVQTARGSKMKMRPEKLADLQTKYQKLIKSDSENPFIQAQNRHRYARMMLINNGILKSNNYESIEFYTQELIACKLGNYRHIIAALFVLNDHIDGRAISKMKSEVEKQINQSIKIQEMIIEKLPGFIAEVKKRPQTSGLQVMIYNLENHETALRKNDINKLQNYLNLLRTI